VNAESFFEYCTKKKGVEECFPFDNNTLVFKVGGKMFALAGLNEFDSINLKSDPQRAVELRETFQGVLPGYHMNKKHWNTIKVDSDVPEKLIQELIDHSYELVYNYLPKRIKDGL
jgi:predicted DNA-binding protein (MmcQ/YjbR family)